MLKRLTGLAALVTALSCGSEKEELQPCQSDAECKGDRICVEGYCESGGEEGTDKNTFNSCYDGCKMFFTFCPDKQEFTIPSNYLQDLEADRSSSCLTHPSECKTNCMDECIEDVLDGHGVPKKFFQCVYDICSGPQLSTGRFNTLTDECWDQYKHQG